MNKETKTDDMLLREMKKAAADELDDDNETTMRGLLGLSTGHIPQMQSSKKANSVPFTIANQLPKIPIRGNKTKELLAYDTAKNTYHEAARKGEMTVSFPQYAKGAKGRSRILSGIKEYSLGEYHPILKRPVNIDDGITQAGHLENIEKYGKDSERVRSILNKALEATTGGHIGDHINKNIKTHDIAKNLNDAVRKLPMSSLVGSALGRGDRHRIITVHDPNKMGTGTATDDEHNTSTLTQDGSRVGITGHVKRPSAGGRKTRKHKRKRKTRKHKRKTQRKTKRKTRRKTKKRKRKTRRKRRKRRKTKRKRRGGNGSTGSTGITVEECKRKCDQDAAGSTGSTVPQAPRPNWRTSLVPAGSGGPVVDARRKRTPNPRAEALRGLR